MTVDTKVMVDVYTGPPGPSSEMVTVTSSVTVVTALGLPLVLPRAGVPVGTAPEGGRTPGARVVVMRSGLPRASVVVIVLTVGLGVALAPPPQPPG
ncbi:MAG TPA: hypothetical protein VGE95_06435, partial [Arthrobacter sp.]